MSRTRNVEWNIETDANGNVSWDQLHAAILMDIRAELRTLNAVFACANFQDVPHKLDRIARNTAKPRKRKLRIVRRKSA